MINNPTCTVLYKTYVDCVDLEGCTYALNNLILRNFSFSDELLLPSVRHKVSISFDDRSGSAIWLDIFGRCVGVWVLVVVVVVEKCCLYVPRLKTYDYSAWGLGVPN